MTSIIIPARALIGTGDRTRAFVTEREALVLATAAGYRPEQARTWLLDDGTIHLKTGAKLSLVPRAFRRLACPTRDRVYQVYGYHYAGSDVSSLFAAVA